MARHAVVFLLLLNLLSGLAASEARIGALGNAFFFTRDLSETSLFPGMINLYPDRVFGELRYKNDESASDEDESYSMGAHLKVDDLVFGLRLNEPVWVDPGLYLQNDTIPTAHLNQKHDFLFGLGSGFGCYVSFGREQTENKSSVPGVESNAQHIGLGAGYSNEEMDIGLVFTLPTGHRELVSTGEKRDFNSWGITLNGRYFLRKAAWSVVPVAGLGLYGAKTEHEPGTDATGISGETVEYDSLECAIGVGFERDLMKRTKILIGIMAIGYGKGSMEDGSPDGETRETETLTLPSLSMGIETNITERWVARLGGNMSVAFHSSEVDGPLTEPLTDHNTHTEYDMHFGLGYSYESLTVDLLLNDDIFFDGPHFLSGKENQVISQISLSLEF